VFNVDFQESSGFSGNIKEASPAQSLGEKNLQKTNILQPGKLPMESAKKMAAVGRKKRSDKTPTKFDMAMTLENRL